MYKFKVLIAIFKVVNGLYIKQFVKTITIQRLASIPLKISYTLKCFDILSDEGFCIAVKKIKVIHSKR